MLLLRHVGNNGQHKDESETQHKTPENLAHDFLANTEKDRHHHGQSRQIGDAVEGFVADFGLGLGQTVVGFDPGGDGGLGLCVQGLIGKLGGRGRRFIGAGHGQGVFGRSCGLVKSRLASGIQGIGCGLAENKRLDGIDMPSAGG